MIKTLNIFWIKQTSTQVFEKITYEHPSHVDHRMSKRIVALWMVLINTRDSLAALKALITLTRFVFLQTSIAAQLLQSQVPTMHRVTSNLILVWEAVWFKPQWFSNGVPHVQVQDSLIWKMRILYKPNKSFLRDTWWTLLQQYIYT